MAEHVVLVEDLADKREGFKTDLPRVRLPVHSASIAEPTSVLGQVFVQGRSPKAPVLVERNGPVLVEDFNRTPTGSNPDLLLNELPRDREEPTSASDVAVGVDLDPLPDHTFWGRGWERLERGVLLALEDLDRSSPRGSVDADAGDLAVPDVEGGLNVGVALSVPSGQGVGAGQPSRA